MRSVVLSLLILAALITRAPAQMGMIPDAEIRRMIAVGTGQVDGTLCGGKYCAPAAAKVKARPLLTVSEGRAVIMLGRAAGIAEVCGIDWRDRCFTPMMQYWRQTKKSERQLALIGVLHGMGKRTVRTKTCSAQTKERWEKTIDFTPGKKPFV